MLFLLLCLPIFIDVYVWWFLPTIVCSHTIFLHFFFLFGKIGLYNVVCWVALFFCICAQCLGWISFISKHYVDDMENLCAIVHILWMHSNIQSKTKKKWNSYIFTRSKTAIEEKYFCLDFFHFLSKKNYFIIWTLNVFFSPVVVFFMKHNAFAWLWFLCVCCRSTGKITRNLSIQRDFVTDESYLGSVIFYTAGKKGK